MKRKERSKSPIADHGDMVFEQELTELADAITESEFEEESVSALADPFEEYVDSMRTKIFANPHLFRARLAKGYHALLHELEHPKK